MDKDISHILKGWGYRPGQVTVRRITGDDGMDKVQLRLDLGLLQMEMVGRPDGKRPHGYESLLHYYQHHLEDHLKRNGTDSKRRKAWRSSRKRSMSESVIRMISARRPKVASMSSTCSGITTSW